MTIGNPSLIPESALAYEIGYRLSRNNLDLSFVGFKRNSDDLIDYVKLNSDDPWQAQNLIGLETNGFEFSGRMKWGSQDKMNALNGDYTYISDNVEALAQLSQYAINSLKHQVIMSWESQFLDQISQQITYRYCERGNGQTYNVLDARVVANFGKIKADITANNILGAAFTETNLVPVPKGSILFSLGYSIN